MLSNEDAARIRVEETFRQEVRDELERTRAPRPDATAGREYARNLFANVISWYGSADTKAQVVLTLDGAFLAFLTGTVFAKPDDLEETLARFTPLTWWLLGAMALCLAASIACALLCLWSRLYWKSRSADRMDEYKVVAEDAATYVPERSWFFQDVRRLDPEQLVLWLEKADPGFELRALAAQAHELSRNVAKKHAWVNGGFVFAGCALVLFLAAGASYLASF